MSSETTTPKKTPTGSLYILISLVLTVSFAAYVLMTWVQLLHNTSFCFGTAAGVISYVQHHEGVMPRSWAEYSDWSAQEPDGPGPADVVRLERTFTLPWGLHVTRETTQPLFIVKDPDLKHLEPALNKKVADGCLASFGDSRAKQPPGPAPASP